MKNQKGEIGPVLIVILVIAALVITPFVYYAVLPWFYNQQYKAERHSQPYGFGSGLPWDYLVANLKLIQNQN